MLLSRHRYIKEVCLPDTNVACRSCTPNRQTVQAPSPSQQVFQARHFAAATGQANGHNLQIANFSSLGRIPHKEKSRNLRPPCFRKTAGSRTAKISPARRPRSRIGSGNSLVNSPSRVPQPFPCQRCRRLRVPAARAPNRENRSNRRQPVSLENTLPRSRAPLPAASFEEIAALAPVARFPVPVRLAVPPPTSLLLTACFPPQAA